MEGGKQGRLKMGKRGGGGEEETNRGCAARCARLSCPPRAWHSSCTHWELEGRRRGVGVRGGMWGARFKKNLGGAAGKILTSGEYRRGKRGGEQGYAHGAVSEG